MGKLFLLAKKEITQKLRQKYHNNHREWLAGGGVWPLALSLGSPVERYAVENIKAVQEWQQHWHAWRGEGEIVWVERRWPGLGTQRLPEKIVFHKPLQVASWIGESERWTRAVSRYNQMISSWSCLSGELKRNFEVLADYEEDDFNRLVAMLMWLEANPNSGLYIRQLPVIGVDTKWIESRESVVFSLLQAITAADGKKDLYDLAGLRKEPTLLRFRLLDAELRRVFGGTGDISAPVEDVARLQLPARHVFFAENLQTGLAFSDLPGSIVFMRAGYAVDLFGRLRWLQRLPCYYWGDIDTHGFAILNRMRNYFPHVKSVLMDKETFLDHRILWGKEEKPRKNAELNFLSDDERELYIGLSNGQWDINLRLEQERIPWSYAWQRLCLVLQKDSDNSSK